LCKRRHRKRRHKAQNKHYLDEAST
jgi:hypothetical protein